MASISIKDPDTRPGRPSSVPPHRSLSVNTSTRSSSRPPEAIRHTSADMLGSDSWDLMSYLERSGPSVVKSRVGSVLSRGFILKTDHYPSGRATDLDLNVHGAPNFRAPRQGHLNVYGTAQPRTQGIRAILSILKCRPNTENSSHVVWFSTREEPMVYISGRPFVLRDSSQPRRTLSLSDRAENLEAIEERLKHDILMEGTRYGGMMLTHNEVVGHDGNGTILPFWTAVDAGCVKTSRELWAQMKREGWNVDYHRIPISPDHPIEDNYLDAYLRVIITTDPLLTALVFSGGMGGVRTTFAMIAALLVRRKQILVQGLEDPYAFKSLAFPVANGLKSPGHSGTATPTIRAMNRCRQTPASSGIGTPTHQQALMHAIEQASAQQDLSKSLLRLTYILQQCLADRNSQSAIELLMSQPTLLENLRKAHMGNYGVILSLLGCLDQGLQAKRLVDRVIDACNHIANLREDILIHRLKYALTTMEDYKGDELLNKAAKTLEKYFFMIAFASYVDSQGDFKQSFSEWLITRTEIWNQVLFLRKSHGSRLNVFAPVNDLSALSRTGPGDRLRVPGKLNDITIAGGQILGDEYSEHVVKNRRGIILREGTLLKSDQWLQESHEVEEGVRGAINFRNVPRTKTYALGQPTSEAIDEVVKRVRAAYPFAKRMVWITLREEPIVYINGAPYCLRREGFSLRNMKDYGGISASRLEVLEERLKEDVISELQGFGGSILLHTEIPDGSVVPIWEEAQSSNVEVLRDIMASRKVASDGFELHYTRIPITAENPPDSTDLHDLIDVVVRTDSANTPIVVNCQLGRGRSTLASIIVLLIQEWLEMHRQMQVLTSSSQIRRTFSVRESISPTPQLKRYSYEVIDKLLRVIRKGGAVKDRVDAAIDQCSTVYNLRDSIEEARAQAELATAEHQKRECIQKALHSLRRYFRLIVFQSYLQSTEPDTMLSFESFGKFVNARPVIKTFEKELLVDGVNALKPLQRVEPADGEANPDEVKQVVMNRSGSILSASTILKSDFFSNLQKMTLPERIEGAPNFRRVSLVLPITSFEDDGKMVCGSGMPTVQGLRNALTRVDAHADGENTVFWTSLREEPVVYIAGRPHVLRLVDRPLENVEATGVATAVVERMEQNFKKDVLRELRANRGRILLHDEVEERPGVFSIVPIWETVSEEDIMTPRDVFDLMAREGFRIDYGRVAITDEQAPMPGALAQLLERIRSGFSQAGDFVFNCQMGRGRTTTGMVAACLICTTMNWTGQEESLYVEDPAIEWYDNMDGPSEEEAYLQGEYKTVLRLVGVLSHGRVAKRLTDQAIDMMQHVQNLRKAVYDYKLKVDACEKGSLKEQQLWRIAVNYLYRYGTLIVFANYLIEMRETDVTFPEWLDGRREISRLLGRTSLE